MKSIFLYLLLFPFLLNAQFKLFQNSYADCSNDSYFEQLGISASQSIDGSFMLAKEILENSYFINNPKLKFQIETLLDYNTKGKEHAFEQINTSRFNQEEKDFLKVWVSYYSKNIDDFNLLSDDFSKKYSNNIDFKKIKYRKILSEFYVDEDKKLEIIKEIDSILKSGLNENDKLYFQLLKLDFTPKQYDKNLNEIENEIFQQFYKLWLSHKSKMSYKGVLKILNNCTHNCSEIDNWIKERNEIENPISVPEKTLLLIQNFDKSYHSITQLETEIDKIYNTENDENLKEKTKAIIHCYTLDYLYNNWNLKKVGNKIEFTDIFLKKYNFEYTKEEFLNKIKTEASKIHKSEKDINEMLNEISKYSTDDAKALYSLLIQLFYYRNMMSEGFRELGMYTDSPSTQIYNDSDELINYLNQNPLFLKDSFIIGERSYPELNSTQTFYEFNKKMDNLKSKYPGSIGVLYTHLILKTYYKKLIPEKDLQDFYLEILKETIDFVSINQSVKIEDYQYYIFWNFRDSDNNTVNPFKDFYNLLDDSHKKAAKNHLQNKINQNPKSTNLKNLELFISKIDRN